ncbi:MAG: hypothetical protein AAGF11_11395 [Myxococcota bacterium]
MPDSMKIPAISDRSQPRTSSPPDPELTAVPQGRPIHSYTYGRLRPRFTTRGAWNELWSLVPQDSSASMGRDGLDAIFAKVFAPDVQGQPPDAFFLARELIWPVEDVYGVLQCLVVPHSDDEIVELLACLGPPSAARASAGYSVVHGTFAGLVHDLGGAIGGLPRVDLVSAFPCDIEKGIGTSYNDERIRLFRAYQPLLANNGVGDELRALNYVLTRSSAFYEFAARIDDRGGDNPQGHRLVGMHALPVEGSRFDPQVEVVVSLQNSRNGAVDHWFQRVNVNGAFMYFTTDKVEPFYRRPSGMIAPQWAEVAPAQDQAGDDERPQPPAPGGDEPPRDPSAAAGSTADAEAVAAQAGHAPDRSEAAPAKDAPAETTPATDAPAKDVPATSPPPEGHPHTI